MGKKLPDGKVIQGNYEGNEIHVWVENALLKIVYGSVYIRPFGEASHTEAERIEKSTVERYQLINSTEKQFSYADYDRASFWFGPVAAAQALKGTTYTVAIYFKNGKKCVAELNSAAYKTLSSACFVL